MSRNKEIHIFQYPGGVYTTTEGPKVEYHNPVEKRFWE